MREVIASYSMFFLILLIGIVAMFVRGEWRNARGMDKLILFGPMFYAAPLAAFGVEHFTLARVIASLVPKWMPWHLFWTYVIGAGFIAAGFSFVTKIGTPLAASLVAFTFFCFVVMMDVPSWIRHPDSRFAITFALRELSFCGGPLAIAASLANRRTTIARVFVAIPVLFFGVEQFLHADHVPGIPLEPLIPPYVFGGAFWSYVAAVVYVVAGVPLLLGIRSREAATWIGAAVLLIVVAVYVPIAVVERTSLDNGFNYIADTLMFCGTVLLLAGALTRHPDGTRPQRAPAAPTDVREE